MVFQRAFLIRAFQSLLGEISGILHPERVVKRFFLFFFFLFSFVLHVTCEFEDFFFSWEKTFGNKTNNNSPLITS